MTNNPMFIAETASDTDATRRATYGCKEIVTAIHYKSYDGRSLATRVAVQIRVVSRENQKPFISITGDPACTFEIGQRSIVDLQGQPDPQQRDLFDPQL